MGYLWDIIMETTSNTTDILSQVLWGNWAYYDVRKHDYSDYCDIFVRITTTYLSQNNYLHDHFITAYMCSFLRKFFTALWLVNKSHIRINIQLPQHFPIGINYTSNKK